MSRTVAYVGSYTDTSDCKGLTLFDVDEEEGVLKRRAEYSVDNASYIAVSHNHRFLYSITDLGVTSFAIQPDGSLKKLNTARIRGMRGCHIALNHDDTYLVVSGFYDGKVTILSINEDGSAGKITCSVFHKGPGSIAERNFRPHCRCARFSRDENYLLVADSGLDQIKVYRFEKKDGTISPIENLHCRQQSGPCFIRFTKDGRFFYCIEELSNTISCYSYQDGARGPEITLVDSVSTINKRFSDISAAVYFHFLEDDRYILCANAGENSAGLFERDAETGKLTLLQVLPISGKYPTSIGIFPDNRHFFVTNHDSNTISFFLLQPEKKLFTMTHRALPIGQPHCSVVVDLPDIEGLELE